MYVNFHEKYWLRTILYNFKLNLYINAVPTTILLSIKIKTERLSTKKKKKPLKFKSNGLFIFCR